MEPLTSGREYRPLKAGRSRPLDGSNECVYFTSDRGHLHTSTPSRLHLAAPITAVIYISVGRTAHVVGVGQESRTHRAGAIRSVGHWVGVYAPSLLAAHVNPLHPHYRRLQMLGGSGVVTLEHRAYSMLAPAMAAACCGELSLDEASSLFDEIVELSIQQLPKAPRAPTANGCEMLALMQVRPDRPLGEVARELGLSYEHASRAFKEATGLTLRGYRLWRKLNWIRNTYRGDKTLTEIAHESGFTDLAHMTRVHSRIFGLPPSRIFRNRDVRIIGPRYPPQEDSRLYA